LKQDNIIPKTDTDVILNKSGYDLFEEYLKMIEFANFNFNNYILDLATGTGRASSVLSRLGYKVITGDFNYKMKEESEKRITKEYLNKILFVQLNMENIPFYNDSVDNIICLNTIHELENPLKCLIELFRIYSGKGKMLIADFNLSGFNIMDEIYKQRYGNIHSRGKLDNNQLLKILNNNSFVIKKIECSLNSGFLIEGKLYA